MKLFLYLFIALLTGCTVTVNLGPAPYAPPQYYVQPAGQQAPVTYVAPLRQPRSIKAVQHQQAAREAAQQQDSSVAYAERERARLTPGNFSAQTVDAETQSVHNTNIATRNAR